MELTLHRLLLGLLMISGVWAQALAQPCYAPSSVWITNTSSTSAQMNWASGYTTDATYEISIKEGVNVPNSYTYVGSVESATTSTYALTGLTNNTEYTARIRTFCGNGGISDYNYAIIRTGCREVFSLYAGGGTSTTKILQWTGQGDPLHQAFNIRYRQVGTADWTLIPNLTLAPTYNYSYTLTGLTGNVTYEWELQGVCDFGPSAYVAGNTFQTICNVNNFYTSVGPSYYQIAWTPNDPGQTYTISWAPQSNPTSVSTATGVTTSYYNFTGLMPATTYTYSFQAFCPNGAQPTTGTSTFQTTSCVNPFNLTTSNLTGTTARLAWINPYQNATAAAQIRYRPTGTGSWSNPVSTTVNSHTLTGLSPATTYEWEVAAVCAPGYPSAYVTGSNFTTSSPPPCPPPIVYGNSSGSDRVWTVNWGRTTGELYNVRYRPVGSSVWETKNRVSSTYGSYTIRGLSASTTYEYQLQTECYDAGTFSGWTASNTFTTSAQQPCLVPVSAGIDQVTDRRAYLYWTDGGYLNAYEFDWQWRSVGSATWQPSTSIPVNYSTLTGLNANTAYEYQVRAVCSPGYFSAFTTPVSFTTLPPINCATLTPTNLTNSEITRSNARFSWNDMISGTTVESYNLRWRPINMSNWIGNVTNHMVNTYPPGFQNLTPNTTYEWQVQTVCPEGDFSPWSGLAQFTTPLCEELTEPTTLVYNEGKALLQWTVQIGSTTYPVTVQYRTKSPVGAWILVSNFNNGGFLTGLTPNVAYEWQVRNNCSNPVSTSDWTPIQSFTALGCIPPPNANLIDGGISGNVAYASIVWRRGFNFDNQTTFNTRWRKLGSATWLTANNITAGGFGQYIGNLDVNATYEWQIQTNCTGGGTSAFSNSYIFSIIPGFYPSGNFYTVKNGDWSDYSVWSTGRVPELSFPGGYATPVEIRHQITLPAGYVAPARTVRYTAGSRLLYGTGARILLGN
ncbi:hypothetical protein GCM10028807_41930 [Spirosoma daeguense]